MIFGKCSEKENISLMDIGEFFKVTNALPVTNEPTKTSEHASLL